MFLLLFAPAMASAHPAGDLMSTGDVDGDGDIDLIRVADDGMVYTMDVNGGDRRSFATMAPETPGDTLSRASSVGSLRDMNSNGSREIVLRGNVAHRQSDGDYLADEYYTEIWDPRTHALLFRRERESASDRLSIVRDLNGDHYRDLARQRSGHIAETVDPTTGLTISGPVNFTWRFFADVVAAPHGLGVLKDRANDDLSDLLEFRNPHTSELTQRIWIGGGHRVYDALSIPDLNGNGSREWAVLRLSADRTRTSVLVVDSRTKVWIRQVWFARWAQPWKLMFVNGTDVAVFSQYDGGAKPLEVRNARTGALVTRTWFPKHLRWFRGGVTRIEDINGNGSHEVAFIGDVDDDHITIIRDTRTGTWLRRLTW